MGQKSLIQYAIVPADHEKYADVGALAGVLNAYSLSKFGTALFFDSPAEALQGNIDHGFNLARGRKIVEVSFRFVGETE